ncbi:MAG: 50S ribosomal protein L1 [Candidatus Bathyarchaeota archaeon]|nr:50S ribosomal protein L1 [Candidatus Bathyarchaeota archaeon]MCW3992740.1 50S ribosomal protein L1 [Candidatus Bathyarchaeota archaeon]
MSVPREAIMDALSKAREAAPERGFEQTVDLTVNLKDLDMRQPDNRVNLRVSVPNGVGGQKVLVFASGDLALRARRAGADSVIEPTELNELASDRKAAKKRLKGYDIFIAEAPLMPTVGRVAGPILGPRGKMPTPVPPQAPIDAILERERRVVILRSRERPFVKCRVGKESMADEDLAGNIEAVLSNLSNSLKRGMNNVQSIYLKLTMGPSVKLL